MGSIPGCYNFFTKWKKHKKTSKNGATIPWIPCSKPTTIPLRYESEFGKVLYTILFITLSFCEIIKMTRRLSISLPPHLLFIYLYLYLFASPLSLRPLLFLSGPLLSLSGDKSTRHSSSPSTIRRRTEDAISEAPGYGGSATPRGEDRPLVAGEEAGRREVEKLAGHHLNVIKCHC